MKFNFKSGVGKGTASQEQTEEKLKLLSSMVEQSTEGMATTDLDGNITFLNNAWCKMHGYSNSKGLLGKNLSIFHNKEQLENKVIPFNKKVRKHGTHSGEVGHITKDRKPFPTLMVSSLLKDTHGKPIGMTAIAKDITEYKKSEEKIKESEERYRIMIENANDMIWTLDTKGNFTFVNSQAAIISGYKFESFNKKSFVPIIHPDDLEMVSDVFQKTLSGNSQQYTVRCYKKKGKMFILAVNTAPIYEKGKIVGTVSFGRDITAQKKAEGEIKKRVEELEKFHKLIVGRELKMIELKKKIKKLEIKLSKRK
ncbi:MAG: PAS domain S-box protein [Nanoarchaeota archaeon]|nr:PAS domain S-box protein [Nanoarchaeota archaeon]